MELDDDGGLDKDLPPCIVDDHNMKRARVQVEDVNMEAKASFHETLLHNIIDIEEDLHEVPNEIKVDDSDSIVMDKDENGFYLVRFLNTSDVEFVLSQGPRMLIGHYLVVEASKVGLLRIFFECVKYVHVVDCYPVKRSKAMGDEVPPEMAANMVGGNQGANHKFGPWMVVTRKGRIGNFRKATKSVQVRNLIC
ncbi:conserved hypothetical protein [Ricinus communis]|uniref:Uncharacterized protein n=1 Tax=Ricinus communis TaxID=3988 RepID=B9T4B5_RICCO|nr:conserved hypothetical protein [Ricinus communis]